MHACIFERFFCILHVWDVRACIVHVCPNITDHLTNSMKNNTIQFFFLLYFKDNRLLIRAMTRSTRGGKSWHGSCLKANCGIVAFMLSLWKMHILYFFYKQKVFI